MLVQPGIYVHFPWCVQKCPYCDFNSHPLRATDDQAAYTQHLLTDWHHQRDELPDQTTFSSVFLGGGTPSLFAPEQIQQVISAFPLTDHAEVTMEANPGTTEYSDFSHYRAAGVNRLSLGAQSFNALHLKQLGRIHSANNTQRAFENARLGGYTNINIDLMWGLPGQTVAQALSDLDQAIGLEAEHISWYQLTIEAKTEFAQRPPILPVDDTLASIEHEGLARLADAGYQRYEVSAFAKRDHTCAHNLNYWSFGDYLGLGAGAHGKTSHLLNDQLKILRTSKPSQPRLYQANPTAMECHEVVTAERTLEFMMNALRLVKGVDPQVYESQTGLQWEALNHLWQPLVEQGLVRTDRCGTTARGLRYLDGVLAQFLNA